MQLYARGIRERGIGFWETWYGELVLSSNSGIELLMAPVVVEKPFVTSSSVADELIALSKEKGKVLTIFHSMLLTLPFLLIFFLPEDLVAD